MSLYATCSCGVPEGQEGAHRTDCPLYGFIPMSGPVCRGSWALGTACRRCERCIATRPLTALTTPPTPDPIGKDAVQEGLREALAEAYRKGATDVHNYWVNNPGEPPQGDPEFGEAASDYASAALDIFDSSARALSATPAQEGEQ